MKLLAANKVLGALLAVVTVGLGVQTYYVVQIHRRLGAGDGVEAAEAAPSAETAQPPPTASPSGPSSTADPFAQLEATEARMQSLFEDLSERLDRSFGESWLDGPPFLADGDSFLFLPDGPGPRVDLQDRGDRYELEVDVPGADEAEVRVRTEDGVLIVEGTRNTTVEESEPGSYVRRERYTGRFERRLSLPSDADPSTLETEQEDGVLRITLRKTSEND